MLFRWLVIYSFILCANLTAARFIITEERILYAAIYVKSVYRPLAEFHCNLRKYPFSHHKLWVIPEKGTGKYKYRRVYASLDFEYLTTQEKKKTQPYSSNEIVGVHV